MPVKTQNKTALFRALQQITEQAQPKDGWILREIEKCPSSKPAAAALAAALSELDNVSERDEPLAAPASWIHPIV